MEVSLVKGEKVDLTKGSGLTEVQFGAGWDINPNAGGASYDLDLFAFALNAQNQLTTPNHITYFGNKEGILGVKVSEDNLTGAGDGDDETIKLDFSKIEENVQSIYLALNIYDATNKNQKFGMVQNSYIRSFNTTSNATIHKFDLNEDFGQNTGVIMGKVYRHNGEWKFEAIGKGVNGDINQIVRDFIATL